ncbi:MAG TPA: hypothetical protein QF641_01585 [Candidatus Thalassarchaeaceae archaeon]|jgi:thiamine pyrophosphokinase|nr:hypothetical protein [Candidatus Thalassarchaeaceae archaeon]|tara:strand:- start:6416 stop:7021 length:606 start_codon:yes stop_codon:yes gene_type:complete
MKGVLWCNGSIPNESVLDDTIADGVHVFGVDGGADKASEAGIDVREVFGDLDSVDDSKWSGKTTELPDQTSSDLAKSIRELIDRGYTQIDVVGADGGDSGHILGNWAALTDAPPGASVQIHHNDSVTRRLHPEEGEIRINVENGRVFSIFALETCRVWVSGSKWDVQGDVISFSTRGLNNEGLGGDVSIRADGILAIIRKR